MAEEKQIPVKMNFFASKWFLGVGFVVLIFIALALGRETYRKYQVQEKIDELQQEVTSLEQNNQELNDMIAFLQTDEYRERQARQKLDLQKEGEQVVIVPELEDVEEEVDKGTEIALSNSEKWWNYFFKIQ